LSGDDLGCSSGEELLDDELDGRDVGGLGDVPDEVRREGERRCEKKLMEEKVEEGEEEGEVKGRFLKTYL